ncbi:MAG: nuclear transport factor 2 family protein [Pseudomonadota bacterium]
MKRLSVILAFALAIAACAGETAPEPSARETSSLETRNTAGETTVETFAAAYNARDIDGMMAQVADDFTWLSVEGDETTIVVSGADSLRSELQTYFQPGSETRSDVEIVKSHGGFVTTLERAYWTVDGDERSQASFAMYEIDDDRIRRVWYFPAQP